MIKLLFYEKYELPMLHILMDRRT